MCVQWTLLYKSFFGLTEVLTVLQCSFMSPYTNSQIYSLRNIFLMASRFLHRSGLPTHRSAYRPNWSVPTDLVLGLLSRFGWCWARLSTFALSGVRFSLCYTDSALVLPLKLGKSGIINPRSDIICRSLLAPKALVKMSTVWRFVLMCWRSSSLA